MRILYEGFKGIFVTFFNLLGAYWGKILVILCLLFVSAFVILCLRIMFARAIFIARLKKCCKKNQIEIQFCSSGFHLLFSRKIKADMKLSCQDKILTLCLFPAGLGRRKLYFHDDKIYLSKIRAISYFNPRAWGFSSSVICENEGRLRQYKQTLPTEKMDHPVLIFCPPQRYVYVHKGNHYAPADNGDRINDFVIYGSKEFPNYMDLFFRGAI